MVSVTQVAVKFGSRSPQLHQLLDSWPACLMADEKNRDRLGAEELVQLAALVAPIVPEHELYERLAQRLLESADALSETAAKSLHALFSEERRGLASETWRRLLRAVRRARQDRKENRRSRSRGRGARVSDALVRRSVSERDSDLQLLDFPPGRRVELLGLGRKLEGARGVVVVSEIARAQGRVAVELAATKLITYVSPMNLRRR